MPTGYLCAHVGFSSALCKGPGGLHSLTSSLSKISSGFPRAAASGCPSEVVRDHTRDKLGKDKGEIPHPLYLFVSLSAIFTYVVVYKILHNTWSYWLGSLGEFWGPGAVMRPCPIVGPGWFLFVPSLPLWPQPCSYLDPRELVREGCAFPSLRMPCWFSIWRWVLSTGAGRGAGGDMQLEHGLRGKEQPPQPVALP